MASFPVSNTTLSYIRSMALVNAGIVLQEGKTQRVLSPSGSVLLTAELPEAWPQQSGLYDVHSFINVLGMFKATTPMIEFSDTTMTVSKGSGAKVHYRMSDPVLLAKSTVSDEKVKKFRTDNPAVSFVLSDQAREQLHKMARLLGLDRVNVKIENKTVTVTAFDSEKESQHGFEYEVPESDVTFHDENFTTDITFNEEHLSLFFEGSYTVHVGKWQYAVFNHLQDPISYLVIIISA